MDSVVDKEQKFSEGRSKADDQKLDLEDLTDDEEVALNLPRKGARERDPPGEEIRDMRGATASGAPVTQQEEWFRMEPPHGAIYMCFKQTLSQHSQFLIYWPKWITKVQIVTF